MNPNVGTSDRIIRVILGIGIIILAVVSHGLLRWTGIVGIVQLLTGMVSFCPAYSLIGIKTCPSRSN